MQSALSAIVCLLAGLMGLAVFFSMPAGAVAAGGPHFALDGGPKFPSGLAMGIDDLGIDANGYRPIRVSLGTVPLNTPLPYDRQLRVVLGFHQIGSQQVDEVSQIIELPEGSANVTTTFLAPQKSFWTSLSVKTFEGGEKLDDLSHRGLGWPNLNGYDWTEARPAILFIDSKVPALADRNSAIQAYEANAIDTSTSTLPDVRMLLNLFPESQNNGNRFINPRAGARGSSRGGLNTLPQAATTQQVTDTVLLSTIDARSRTAMIPPGEMPQRWIELSQYDVAVISLADLRQLAANRPKQFAALRDWLSTGPLLIVHGAGSRFENLPQIEKLLQLPPQPSFDPTFPELSAWFHFRHDRNAPGVAALFDESSDAVPVGGRSGETNDQKPQPEPLVRSGSGPLPPFVFRPAATGCVVAIAAENPFPGVRDEWDHVFSQVSQSHWQWYKRSGFSLHRKNSDYWTLLIPGVGEAPVYSFLFLVSLFAIVIGPVNFLLLGRARRLYLLLLTVPAGALLVTGSLFVFALVSDGFTARLRVRSYADLDQTTGRAAVWSRQSYYAGIAPSRGLRFPDDTTVFPVAYEPQANSNDKSTLLVWDGDQHLRDGYLSSRTAAQFVVCRATTTKARLLVREGSSAPIAPQVENRLETFVKYLLVRDSRGNYFDGKGIREGATLELVKTEPARAEADMKELAKAVAPDLPHNFDPQQQNENIFSIFGIRYSRYGSSDSSLGDPLMKYSLLESNLENAIRPTTQSLALGTYIAIVENSPLVVTGFGRVREEASFHVIRGRY